MATNLHNPKFNHGDKVQLAGYPHGGISIIISHLYSEILKQYIYLIECHGEISIYVESRLCLIEVYNGN